MSSASLSLTMNEAKDDWVVAALMELSDRRRLPPETTPAETDTMLAAETDTTEPHLRMGWKRKRSRQIMRAGLEYTEKEKNEERKQVTSPVTPLSWSFGVGLPGDGFEASMSRFSKGKSKALLVTASKGASTSTRIKIIRRKKMLRQRRWSRKWMLSLPPKVF